MRSPATAIAWEFRRKHRWGLLGLAGYLLVLGIVRLVIPDRRIDFENDLSFALVVIVPLTATFMYFLAVFSFGIAGDVAARRSIYPARMFTLPVTTAALAGWPMLFGSAAMAMLWLATRLLAVWPSRVDVPLVWPAFLAAALLAWTQALTWMPYALPGLRVLVTVLWLVAIDAVVMLALELKAPEPVMLAILLPQLPLAYLAARFAVARARRGDVPDWQSILGRLGRLADLVPHRGRPFASPASAQSWLEWRRHGRSLPAMVGIVLPFELTLLFVLRDSPGIVLEILICVLITPPFLAAFARSESTGLSPFVATRPMTSVALVAAKLKMAIRSALATWLLVLVAIPLALRLSGTAPLVSERARRVIEVIGTPRAVAWVLLVLSALVASTWRQLVQSLLIGLSGRDWAVKASVFGTLSILAVAGPLLHWMGEHGEVRAALWNALPWIAAVLVCVKISAAFWIAVRLRDRGLLGDRTLVAGAACWSAGVLALYGLLAWLLSPLFGRGYFLALVAILLVPLVRLSAAPLSLAWNRHR